MTPEVGLGDLLRAWHAVGRDPDLALPLARMLGLAGGGAAAPIAPAMPVMPTPSSTTRTPRKAPGSAAPRSADGPTAHGDAIVVTPLAPAPTAEPAWWEAPPLARARAAPPVLAAPLFPPVRERALLGAMARSPRAEGELDVPHLITLLASGRPPRVIPRRRVPSLRGGAQVIVDRATWMMPFHAETARLVERLRLVAGESLEVVDVPELPPAVLTARADEPARWQPPRTGTAIIVISDLGRTASVARWRHPREAWRGFLATIRTAGFAPLVVVPGRASSYAVFDGARRDALLVSWDPTARLADIVRYRKAKAR